MLHAMRLMLTLLSATLASVNRGVQTVAATLILGTVRSVYRWALRTAQVESPTRSEMQRFLSPLYDRPEHGHSYHVQPSKAGTYSVGSTKCAKAIYSSGDVQAVDISVLRRLIGLEAQDQQ